jgi:hypothetical protein
VTQFDFRNPSSQRKLEIVNSLVLQLKLPENYDIVERCYRAIYGGFDDYVRRIKQFFLTEGEATSFMTYDFRNRIPQSLSFRGLHLYHV